ncbi:HypC/HybG/HupF family hydrogenase formation chaperone [uncultured Cohaesibacter sp.]|uniref:HypC/HybG/HupF family hydrogenase formation chaperone n=1 Tax=uncultured Cohaesibacter sp. TaxID=1002546 RepID=UPI0029C6BA8C|nr:HypC/HybG/HupF family hydrogenase formation chaperone [uncultured Cohaesibacter sp.]
MCVGVPMKVVEAGFGYAICDDRGARRHIDTMLVGEVEEGAWLLVFIDAAREVIAEEDAEKILDALSAVEKVMNGAFSTDPSDRASIDLLFADLVDKDSSQTRH